MREDINKRLLKKRRGILSRYIQYERDGRWRIRYKGMTVYRTDLSKTKDFYIAEMEKARAIIHKLENL